jgi:(1->4)-alpha-D-glucan 1-alpha-D-glucosylmutase
MRFIERLLEIERPNPFLEDFVAFQQRIAWLGALNGLSQTALTLTAPGVPDLYQGGDLWDLNMVDPDNRRSIDFDSRRQMLADCMIDETSRRQLVRNWLTHWRDGRIKLALVSALLRCRRRHADLFRHGGYEPIAIDSQHLIAFARRNGNQACVVIAGRLFARLMRDSSFYDGAALWSDLRVEARDLPARLTNVLTGQAFSSAAGLDMGEVLADLPVAVLIGQA